MKSIHQQLAEKFDELESRGQQAKVIEIRESGKSWEAKLADAERALGVDLETSEARLAESARRAFNISEEDAREFARFNPEANYWEEIKRMD